MPRILPWKRREEQAPQLPSSARSSPVTRVKREDARRAQDEVGSVSPSDAGTSTKKTLKRPRRSASTSPPPEPLQENFMIEGIDGDDRYRMVEDEFLATAQQFTAHLHAAEYKRLKSASALENAQMIRKISRPVVGQMTDLVKIKQDRKTLIEKQRLATRKLRKGDVSGDESSGTDDLNDSWQKQSLHGLMESPGKRARRLDGLPSATLVTRAGAGYNRRSDVVSPTRPKPEPKVLSSTSDRHKHEEEYFLDDLDSYRIAPRTLQSGPTSSRMAAPRITRDNGPPLNKSYKVTENLRTDRSNTAEKTVVSDDDNETDFMTRLKKRQEERRRVRDQRKSMNSNVKSNSDDILPDFM
ncbi:hypothetical protein E0Z10_g2030 [Xylaria hypoxylon]|uniref:Uncharacterized protein n=1 Tax=Xylaria hypoxylon TaxID=37992 RepID=A0A4Z0ZDD4_9PEZI|nr:hypothetical protein E0Z10_g2030 [Xylaria hypoxylon]